VNIRAIRLVIIFITGLSTLHANAVSAFPRYVRTGSVSAAFTLVDFDADGKKDVRTRSVGFLAKQLQGKGFQVVEAKRHGFLYYFKVTKDGYTILLTVDGRSADIVGLTILDKPANAVVRQRGSSGNNFVDETYEFGVVIEETVYESYYSYTEEEIETTESESYSDVYMDNEEITEESTEVDVYEENMSTEEMEAEDLGYDTPEDASDQAEIDEPVADYPDETAAEEADEPSDGGDEE
jgi:hypothetical protein